MQQTVTERLTNLVTDPLFWIVTVFIAMIVSIFANYATRGTDRVVSLFSNRRRELIEEENKFIDQEVERMMKSPQDRFDVKLDVIWQLLRSLLAAFMAVSILFSIFFIYTLFIILEPLPEMIIAPLGVFGFLSTIIFAWYLRLFLRHSRRERRDWLTNLIYC